VSYEYISDDMPSGTISLDEARKIVLYKYVFNTDDYEQINESKAQRYGSLLAEKTGYGTGVGDEVITVELEEDSLARRHICVTVTGTYKIPFSEGLEIFGMEGTRTFTAVSYAECADITDYLNTVRFADRVGSILFGNSKSLSMINSWLGVLSKINE